MDLKIKIDSKEYKFGKLLRAKEQIYNETNSQIEKSEDDDKNYELMRDTLVKLYDNQFAPEDIDNNLETFEVLGAWMDILIYKQSKANEYIESRKKLFTQGKRKK